jgi:hypothetical protein
MDVLEAPVTQTVTTADVLNRAADLLEEFGWRQESTGSRQDGSMCAVGAIYEASEDFGFPAFSETARQACAIDGFPDELEMWPLAVWNDEPGRTKAEVVARLREAARSAA